MKAKATTTVDVHRDADTEDRDGYQDETETTGPPVYENIPFSIIEQTRRAPDPTSGSLVPVSALIGRCGAEHVIRKGDRIHDRLDGAWYAVADATHPQSPIGTLDRRLELTRSSNAIPEPWEPAPFGLGWSALGGVPV